MIAALVGVRLDAWRARHAHSLVARAEVSRWVAANVMASCGVRYEVRGSLPTIAERIGIQPRTLTELLAALASGPALVEVASLPAGWAMALAALGVPLVDEPASRITHAGVSVLTLNPMPPTLTVSHRAAHVQVELAQRVRLLAA
jgi:hypothetical protein